MKIFKPLIKWIMLRELAKPDTRVTVISFINSKIDLPKMKEKEEEKLFEQIYDAAQESLKLVIERI